jgi:succinoglycan biosynthesis transport protein ExoP
MQSDRSGIERRGPGALKGCSSAQFKSLDVTERTQTLKPADGGAGSLTFLDYLRPAWRFKFPLILLVVVAAGLTYAVSNRSPKSYGTSATMYVGQSVLQQALSPAQAASGTRSIADEAELIQTPQVAGLVKQRLHLRAPEGAILGAISAAASGQTDFVTITARTGDPVLAAKLANGFARAFITLSNRQLISGARVSLAATERQLSRIEKLDTASTSAKTTSGGASTLATPATTDDAVITSLEQQVQNLEGIIATPPSQGQLIRRAGVPGLPLSPRPKRDAVFAGVIALVLGLILCYLIDRTDLRVRRLSDVDSLFDRVVLASIPHISRRDRRAAAPAEIPSSARESFSSLRVNLDLARLAGGSMSVIVVTSALADEGKSTVARNLALGYQEAGVRVALVEADFRRPTLARSLGVHESPGLSEHLAGEGPLSIQSPPGLVAGDLGLIVAGRSPVDPTVLLNPSALQAVFSELRENYDVILVDSPPLVPVSDSLQVLGASDGAIIVIRSGTSTRAALERMRTTMERVANIRSVEIFGVIANDTRDRFASYYRTPAKNGKAPHGAPDREQVGS